MKHMHSWGLLRTTDLKRWYLAGPLHSIQKRGGVIYVIVNAFSHALHLMSRYLGSTIHLGKIISDVDWLAKIKGKLRDLSLKNDTRFFSLTLWRKFDTNRNWFGWKYLSCIDFYLTRKFFRLSFWHHYVCLLRFWTRFPVWHLSTSVCVILGEDLFCLRFSFLNT